MLLVWVHSGSLVRLHQIICENNKLKKTKWKTFAAGCLWVSFIWAQLIAEWCETVSPFGLFRFTLCVGGFSTTHFRLFKFMWKSTLIISFPLIIHSRHSELPVRHEESPSSLCCIRHKGAPAAFMRLCCLKIFSIMAYCTFTFTASPYKQLNMDVRPSHVL